MTFLNMANARLKIISHKKNFMNDFINEIKKSVDKLGSKIKGPIPIPTKKLKITTRKSPDGEGKASFDNFEMRIHKRLIEFDASNDRLLKSIMRIPIPKGVKIELKIV
jgi:small subunit ribosomal protein S10